MGLLKKLTSLSRRKADLARKKKTERQCQFEVMEPRIVLSADPVIAGVTYFEGDSGQDTEPDHFEVTFAGGSETTGLTQFVINGDQDGNGVLSDGDVFFDVAPGIPGSGGSHEFNFDSAASLGITEQDILNVNVSENGLVLTVELQNFEAGDLFAFTIDVDEVENLNIDEIASGVEFEASQFQATFEDEHFTFVDRSIAVDVDLDSGFTQNQQEGIFYDDYDALLARAEEVAGASINLERDNETGRSDRSTAAVDAFDLIPRPVTISGTVYEDGNLNWVQDGSDAGIADVQINLQRLNVDTGQYESVATTTTDANGDYEFGLDLNLPPGTYQLVQVQPDGYLDVGALPGTVEGTESGSTFDDSAGNENVITEIQIPLGDTAATDYDFKEIRPAAISGNVYHDRNDDGFRDPGEEGIANVLIQITRVGAKEGAIHDPFENAPPIFVRTDANGFYTADGLPPGIYEVVEINNYPPGEDPLEGFIDGQDRVGTVGGETHGVGSNDMVNTIELCAGEEGVNYDFGELRPASISGYVSITTPEGDKLDPTDPNFNPITGVTLQLLDEQGNLLEEAQTDANGFYQFTDLAPGTYSVVQVQPDGFLDGQEVLGNVDGQETGILSSNDRFDQITLTSDSVGTRYDFCEHIPAEIHGTVFHDQNDDGVLQDSEERIGGVTLQLLNESGEVISETQTDIQGEYWFTGLERGTYSVREIQPVSFDDGFDSVGTVDGVTIGDLENDLLTNIDLNYGDVGVEYNFGEIRLASISGTVHADANGDCNFNAADGDMPLEGVVLQLFDANGELVAETTTDANGEYIFDGLWPGEYSIREFTPDGFLDGAEHVGTVDGQLVGQASDDMFFGITLASGENGVNYDFCEHIPAEIHGNVFHDVNDDGIFQDSEDGIANVTIQLFDDSGNLVAETTTNVQGEYWFTGLQAGTYKLNELQPDEFTDGQDRVGTVDGVAVGETMNDMFNTITLNGGDQGVEYNFGELLPASISGFVHVDMNGNCTLETEAGDNPLANVTLQLLNADGQVIATTQTDELGFYEFNDLEPGEYSIRQLQPEQFFDGATLVGSGDGEVTESNLITGINLGSGQRLLQYNFCEHPGAEIHGRVFVDGPAFETEDGQLPEGFRDQRDGIFQAGVDTPLAGVRVSLFVNTFEGENLVTRAVTLADVLPGIYTELGTDPTTEVSVLTDENGEYWFTGLQAGNYVVLEEQPDGVFDANDIPGTTTGSAVNADTDEVPSSLLQFSADQQMDALFGVNVEFGGASFQNNFTEVTVLQVDPPPVEDDGQILVPSVPGRTASTNPLTPSPGIQGLPGLFGALPISQTQLIGTSVSVNFPQEAPQSGNPYSWHLSVVNAGQPRAELAEGGADDSIWKQASFISESDWNRFDMDASLWVFTETRSIGDIGVTDNSAQFGMIGGIPLAGDFDGDGSDEIAVFKDGYWMIDLNHNGRWDQADLLATLGDGEDRPVVGDWDGDGKDDIGIYGPIWERDPEAISRDPGLPNPENDPDTKPKNVPPSQQDATNGARVMKLSSYGRQRVDVVDHVFGIGEEENMPITGDWNGNGIRSIGYFNNGEWQFDVNGDGRFNYQDAKADFGRAGDIPLVGDFNGDGIEEIAVYRSGTWLIDTNGNREIDAADKTFQLGGAGDKPVVGDWDGDGIDEPAIYRQGNGQNYQ